MNKQSEPNFEPPYPKPISKKDKLSLWQLIKRSRKSSLHIFFEGHYKEDFPSYSLPGLKIYTPNDPELIKEILKHKHQNFPKHKFLSDMLAPLIGKGIFSTNGETWQRQRRIMDVGFEKAGLKNVYHLMVDAVEDMHRRLDKVPEGEEVKIDQEMTVVTADIIMRTILSSPITSSEAHRIFGYFEDYQEKANSLNVLRAFKIPTYLSVKNHLLWKRRGRQIRQFMSDIINKRYHEFVEKGGKTSYGDILEVLMGTEDPVTKAKFSRKELVDQVVTLFLAGHETTASALSWTFYLLAHQPRHALTLLKESQEVYNEQLYPSFREINKLKKTRDVFKETLRLYPPLAIISRQAKNACPLGKRNIEANAAINICPWLIHRRESLWKDPHAFRPERFSEGENKKTQGAYIPFSMGPRVCVGAGFAMQEALLIISTVVKRFQITPVDTHRPDPIARLTLRSENGIRVKLTNRGELVKGDELEENQQESISRDSGSEQCPFGFS